MSDTYTYNMPEIKGKSHISAVGEQKSLTIRKSVAQSTIAEIFDKTKTVESSRQPQAVGDNAEYGAPIREAIVRSPSEKRTINTIVDKSFVGASKIVNTKSIVAKENQKSLISRQLPVNATIDSPAADGRQQSLGHHILAGSKAPVGTETIVDAVALTKEPNDYILEKSKANKRATYKMGSKVSVVQQKSTNAATTSNLKGQSVVKGALVGPYSLMFGQIKTVDKPKKVHHKHRRQKTASMSPINYANLTLSEKSCTKSCELDEQQVTPKTLRTGNSMSPTKMSAHADGSSAARMDEDSAAKLRRQVAVERKRTTVKFVVGIILGVVIFAGVTALLSVLLLKKSTRSAASSTSIPHTRTT